MPLTYAQVKATVSPTFNTNFGQLPTTLQNSSITLDAGTTANKADLLYLATRSTGTGGDAIDLNGGGLLQPDGTAFNAVELVSIVVVNRSSTASLTVGGGSNPVANVGFTVKPGGQVMLATGNDPAYPITVGSADTITVTGSAASTSYDVVIIGRSA